MTKAPRSCGLTRPLGGTLVAAGLLLLGGLRADADDTGIPDFRAALSPEEADVVIDSTVVLELVVDASAVQFNGYELEITFDPAILTAVSVEEGPLLTESGCERWWVPEITASSVRVSHALLCFDGELDGPGVLMRVTFTALAEGESPLTIITDPDRAFVDDGLWVAPTHPTFPRQVVVTDALVRVRDTIIGVDEPVPPAITRVRFVPNPTTGAGVFDLDGRDGPAEIAVYGPAGRAVWTHRVERAVGAVSWPGVDLAGRAVAPGTYFYRISTPGTVATGRVVVVP